MLYVVIGTKAQLIKMGPVMAELQNQNIDYVFIFTGQHQENMKELIEDFSIKSPDIVLYKGKDIKSIISFFPWSFFILIKFLLNKKKIINSKETNIFLVHGDTSSTVLGAIMGRLSRSYVAHLESGLRSYKLFNPFPEELQRLATFKLANLYFCPGEWALGNVKKYKGKKVNIIQNTLIDSLRMAQSKKINPEVIIPKEKYCIVSLHRFENIVTKQNLETVINQVESIATKIKVLFILHLPTISYLKKHNVYNKLKSNPNIELRNRYSYVDFVHLLSKSEFVITDGGSNQEECYYLGHPCLLLRSTTERKEGLGKNVVISEYNPEIISDFVDKYRNYRRPPVNVDISPSRIIVNYLVELTNNKK